MWFASSPSRAGLRVRPPAHLFSRHALQQQPRCGRFLFELHQYRINRSHDVLPLASGIEVTIVSQKVAASDHEARKPSSVSTILVKPAALRESRASSVSGNPITYTRCACPIFD